MGSGPCVDCQGKAITQQEAEAEWKEGICDVCRRLKKDKTMKKVKHCDFCNANICAPCMGRFDLRILAAVIEAFDSKTKDR